MTRFIYKAKNNKGEVVTGTVKAENSLDAEKVLVKHGLSPVDLVEEKKSGISGLFAVRVSIKDKALFSRQLATMLSAGLSLTKAISLLIKQAKNEKVKGVFQNIYKDLEEGYSFSTALAKHPDVFDRVYVSVVNSGESTGKLDMVLNELADELENDAEFQSKVKGALYYPIFIFCVLIVAAVALLVFVVPKIKGVFEATNQTLPIATRILLSASNFVTTWWWLVLILLVMFVIFLKYWSVTDSGERFFDNLKITIPGYKTINQNIYMYRFTRVMSMLTGAGVPLLDALRIGSAVINNVVYEDSVTRIVSEVERGVPLSSQLLKDKYFPPLVGNMVSVGEETGELDKVLKKISEYYGQATGDITKAISALVEPVVMVLIGLAVAFIVFAIYLPIFQMNQTVS